jgi:hypothetical protein
VRILRIGGGCGDHRTRRQSILDRRRCVDKVGGVSDTEIRRDSPAHSAICLDRLVLARWQPEFYPRQVFADLNDAAKMLDALQIAGVMPAKMAILGLINQGGDRVYPTGMGQTPEAFVHCGFYIWKRISAAHGVTMEANCLRKLLQEAAKTAAVRRKRIAVPRHLARVAKRSADGESLPVGECGCPHGFHFHWITLPSDSLAPFVMPKYRPSS